MDTRYLSGKIHTFFIKNTANDCPIQYNFFSLNGLNVLKDGKIVVVEREKNQGINVPINLSYYFFSKNFDEFLYLKGQCEKTFTFSYLHHENQNFVYAIKSKNQKSPSIYKRYAICFNCSIRSLPTSKRKSFCFPVKIEEYPDIFIIDLNFSYPLTIEAKEKIYLTAEGVPEGTNIIKRMFDTLPNYFASFFEIFNEEDIEK